MQTVRRVLAMLSRRERLSLALLVAMSVVQGVLELLTIASITPFLVVVVAPEKIQQIPTLAWLYERLGFDSDMSFMILLAGASLAAVIASNTFAAFNLWAQTRFTEGRVLTFSVRLLRHYLQQPYEFHLTRHSADLGKNILAEVHELVASVIGPLVGLMSNVLSALAIVVLLVIIDARVALFAAAMLGGSYGLFYALVRRRLSGLGRERLVANRERFKHAAEAFGGIKDTKLLGREHSMLALFEAPAARMARVTVRATLIRQLPQFALQIVAFGGILTIAMVVLVSRAGDLSVVLPMLGVFAFAGIRLLPKIQAIFQLLARLRFGAAPAEAIYRDLVAQQQPPGAPVAATQTELPLREAIVVKDVEYRYPAAEQAALRGVNLTVPANATVGLMGPTGSGKTTLADVVLGLLTPQRGEVCIDGRRLDSSSRRAWLAQIGYVPQHIFLTDDTVAHNIAFGVPTGQIDQAAVEWAARVANIHDFVMQELPAGYATMLGERGIRLSGGQRQRIGIARALYRNPKVLVLDEATSALDTGVESAVMAAINRLAGTRTIIVIAHRLSTLRSCSRIYEVAQGRIVREGGYAELFGSPAQPDRRTAP